MLADDDRAGAERRRRAQDRADIVRVADLVEHDDDRAALCYFDRAEHILEIGAVERLDLERPALVHGAVRQQPVECRAIEHLDRLALALARAAPLGRCRGDQLRSLGFLIGEHCEASPAPRRISQCRGDRVAPIDPIAAAAAPAAGPWRARFLRPAERRRPFEAALPGSLLWRAWLSQGFSSGVASGNKIGCSST